MWTAFNRNAWVIEWKLFALAIRIWIGTLHVPLHCTCLWQPVSAEGQFKLPGKWIKLMLESMQSKIELLAYTWKCKFANRKQQKDCNSKTCWTISPTHQFVSGCGRERPRPLNCAHGVRFTDSCEVSQNTAPTLQPWQVTLSSQVLRIHGAVY